MVHERNIRAVVFHPDGQHIILAAPDPPRSDKTQLPPCRLYCFNMSCLHTGRPGQNPEGKAYVELLSLPFLIPQVYVKAMCNSHCDIP